MVLAAAVPLLGLLFVGWRMYDRRGLPQREQETPEQKYAAARDAFSSGPVDEAGQTRQINELFTALGKAMVAQDFTAAGSLVDVPRMVQEVKRLGGLAKLNPKDERALTQGMTVGTRNMFANAAPFMAWSRHEIKSVKFLSGGREAVVFLRTWPVSDPELIGKFRWWVRYDGQRWKTYDWEDLDGGVRVSTLMSAMLSQFDPRAGPPAWLAAMPTFQQAMTSIAAQDLPAAEKALTSLDGVEFPGQMEALRWMLKGSLRMGQGSAAEALPLFDKAEAMHADMPVVWQLRANALNMLGRHEEALAQARKYVQALGDDSEAYAQTGTALEGLGRTAEAAQAYAKGLADLPNSATNAAGLARTGGQADWAGVLGKASDPRPVFVGVANELLGRIDADPAKAAAPAATLQTLVDAYRKLRPADPVSAYYDARVKMARKQHAEAAAVLEKALASAPQDDQAEYQRVFVWAMSEEGKPIEGYRRAPDARAALTQLAWSMRSEEHWQPLRELVAAHRARVPDDAWSDYFEAVVAGEGDRQADKADELFARAIRSAATDADRDVFRNARVRARHAQGKGLLAYEQADDRLKVFSQLAWLYSSEGKAGELEKLVAAHTAALASDPALGFWEAEVAFLKRNYPSASAKLLEVHRTLPRELAYSARDRLVRALVRQGQHDQAARHIRAPGAPEDDAWLKLIVLAAQGNAGETETLITQMVNEGYEVRELYDDEDLAAALATEAMKPIREKYPRPKDEVEARE